MQKITHELYEAAMKYGYRFDIGQLSLSERRELDKQIKQGKVVKCSAIWPHLMTGFRDKTCYVYLQRPQVNRLPSQDGGRAA